MKHPAPLVHDILLMMRFAPLAILGLFIALLSFGLISQINATQNMGSTQISRPLPAVSLKDIYQPAARFHLPEDSNKEPYLLNIFASWCAPCNVEHPVLQTIADETGLAIYGMAWRDKEEDTKAWLQKNGNFYRRVGVDETGASAIELGLTGVPETFFLSPEGVILGAHKGPVTETVYESWLKPLIKEHATHAE